MLTLIPTPIGNLEDITLRAMRLFEEAELFLCEDTRETKHLLRLLQERFGMQKIDVEFLSFHEHNGTQRLIEIDTVLREKNVIYVSDAGMPAISDPGQLLVAYCQKEDIAYDVLPGANAALTAYVASGFASVAFNFFGFLPHKGAQRKEKLTSLLSMDIPTILYESPHRLLKLLEELSVLAPSRELFLAKELTKKFQNYFRGDANKAFEHFQSQNIRGEWVVIIDAKKEKINVLYMEDIVDLDIAPKIKAKLIAKLSGKSIKECYDAIITKEK
ncbi:MAG: 16S rRNA (cytidine(1402)-2'-O)-methyltransferase [Campylobacterales bacterium]|nr:16S rRNA (cytidine(1402)-2'-O)-methyltransferase [Campylobacterales bacterium]